MSKTFSIPVSNGILEPSHVEKIGPALWVFLWMIDHITKESAAAAACQLEGLVLDGHQIRASTIAKDLGLASRTVHEHIERLCKHGYVRRIDAGEGMPAGYAVQKSKKWKKNSIHQVANLADNRFQLARLLSGDWMLRGLRDDLAEQGLEFGWGEDISHESPDALLPEAVATGKEPLLVIGAVAGG